MLITFLLPSGKNKFRLNWSGGKKDNNVGRKEAG